MKLRTVSVSAFMLCASIVTSSAEVRFLSADEKTTFTGQDINIYFFGPVTENKVIDLTNVIDTLNINHPETRQINLFINSPGGDMDAGWAGYWAIKSSAIPVRSINLSYVASAATLLYCATDKRESMSGARFLLHPAANLISQGAILKPDVLDRMNSDLELVNNQFMQTYKQCTNLEEKEIKDLLRSEYLSKLIDDKKAMEIGLSETILNKKYPARAVAYISDKEIQ